MAAYYKVEVTLNSQAVQVGLPSPQSVRVTLPLVGPQGPVGDVGPAGPEGPQGVPGTGLEVLTTQGDILYQGATTGERLPIGSEGEVLKVESGVPAWGAAGEAYDQSLNTTDAPTFTGLKLESGGAQGELVVFEEGEGTIFDFVTDGNAQMSLSASQLTVGVPVVFATTETASDTRDNLGLGTAATSDAGDFAAAVHGHVAADVSDFSTAAAAAAPVSSVAGRTGTVTLAVADVANAVSDTDARLSDARTPTSHASSHFSAGADPIAPSDIGAQSLFTTTTYNITSTGSFTLAAARAQIAIIINVSSNARTVTLPTTGNLSGDVAVVRANPSIGALDVAGSAGGNETIPTTGSRRYVYDGSQWQRDPVYTHEHAASAIASGTLDIGRLPVGTTTNTVAAGDDSRFSDIPDPSSTTPQALGTAAAGTSDDYSRGDHVHAAPALDDLSNVSAAAPSDNDVLTFDTGTGTWVAEAAAASGIASDITGITGASAITNIVAISQDDYDDIVSPDAATLFIITD
jgi:hypothetical protein